ncbi:hypothetical protein CDL15_Pgr011873 [Punica granatum]|uniref:Uncharacterized protein n=1 Tax=Punica granatum TaxID=22663 RepID=A0A218XFD3_PUNGR|nr:hypothetical protein CDL15_Pgr011873 [Punica granatum]
MVSDFDSGSSLYDTQNRNRNQFLLFNYTRCHISTYQIKSNDPNISPSYATVHLSHKIAPLSSSSLSFLLTLSLAYVFLAKMVQNFIKDSNEKQSAAKCVHNRCNCFNGNGNNGSEDELDGFGKSTGLGSFGDDCDALKKNKSLKGKDDLRKIVITDSLSSLGYDSSICKSEWDKSSSFPVGEYKYIDMIVQGERLLIDIDFRLEFEIARSTGAYRARSLPYADYRVSKTCGIPQVLGRVRFHILKG